VFVLRIRSRILGLFLFKIISTMKHILFVLFVMATYSAFSQQGAPVIQKLTDEDRAQTLTENLSKELSLNETQMSKSKKIHLSYLKKLNKARLNFDNNDPKARNNSIKEMQSCNTVKEKAILKILNPDQKKIYEERLVMSKAVKKQPLTIEEKPKLQATPTTKGQ